MTLRTDRSRANLYSDAPSPLAKKGVGKGTTNNQLKSAPATSEGYRNSHGGKPVKKAK